MPCPDVSLVVALVVRLRKGLSVQLLLKLSIGLIPLFGAHMQAAAKSVPAAQSVPQLEQHLAISGCAASAGQTLAVSSPAWAD